MSCGCAGESGVKNLTAAVFVIPVLTGDVSGTNVIVMCM